MHVELEKAGSAVVPATNGGHVAGLLRRRGFQLALAAVLLVLVWGVWSWVQFGRASGGLIGLFTQTDFPAVTIVSRMVGEGQDADMYNLRAQLEGQHRLIAEGYLELPADTDLKYPYPYAPFIAVLMSPLHSANPLAAWAFWNIVNLLGMMVGLLYLLKSLALPRNTRLVLLLGGLTSFPFIVNLEQGQSSGVVMLALGLGIRLLKQGRDLPAGLALGLLVLKVQWLPFIVLVLAWKRRPRALLGMVLTGIALTLLTGMVAGWGWIPGYVDILVRAQQYARELLLDPWYSHSLSGGIAALLGPGSDGIIRGAMLAAMLGAAALVMWAWRGTWRPSEGRWDGAMALTLLAALFTNPQLNTHDLSLLAAPCALGLAYLLSRGVARSVLYWQALIWLAYFGTAFFLPQVYALPVRLSTLAIVMLGWLLVYNMSNKNPNSSAETIPSLPLIVI